MRLPSLYGNEPLKAALAPLDASSFGSAVILDGPDGCGKTTAALDIAMALLCTGKDAPCQTCNSCLRIRAGSHPDFTLFNPEKTDIKVDDVRALRARSFVRPSEADFKVFVICCADRMNVQAQNALLKVLEEPQSTVFLLLCQNRESLLQTIRSRAATYRVSPLTGQELERALHARHPDISPAQLHMAATQAGGVLGRAEELLAGEGQKTLHLAQQFVSALEQNELALMECAVELSKLSRNEYAAFCDSACMQLKEAALRHQPESMIAIFEYIETQRQRLNQNASTLALSSALCAFCGELLTNARRKA